MLNKIFPFLSGIALTAGVAIIATFFSSMVPYHLISAGVLALLLGMLFHPVLGKILPYTKPGVQFSSNMLLRTAIILMGLELNFKQVLAVGKLSFIVMSSTLFVAFFVGYLLGKAFKMNWHLSSLISAGTGICGGTAIMAISPVIKAEDKYIAYALSSTFIFDVLMVVLFPLMGKAFNMSDLGYGLWAGTAVNDTSSVVAAGYAFSDAAGNYSLIVKLTRTLSIIPAVFIFAFISLRTSAAHHKLAEDTNEAIHKVNLLKVFPWFILFFLGAVFVRSLGFVSEQSASHVAEFSKFFMVMALAAIGLKTNFQSTASLGIKPLIHSFVISLLVVIAAYFTQALLGQL